MRIGAIPGCFSRRACPFRPLRSAPIRADWCARSRPFCVRPERCFAPTSTILCGEDTRRRRPRRNSHGAAFPGNCYLEYQEYLRQLSSRGVLLAIVSKNNEADVREAFQAARPTSDWASTTSSRPKSVGTKNRIRSANSHKSSLWALIPLSSSTTTPWNVRRFGSDSQRSPSSRPRSRSLGSSLNCFRRSRSSMRPSSPTMMSTA